MWEEPSSEAALDVVAHAFGGGKGKGGSKSGAKNLKNGKAATGKSKTDAAADHADAAEENDGTGDTATAATAGDSVTDGDLATESSLAGGTDGAASAAPGSPRGGGARKTQSARHGEATALSEAAHAAWLARTEDVGAVESEIAAFELELRALEGDVTVVPPSPHATTAPAPAAPASGAEDGAPASGAKDGPTIPTASSDGVVSNSPDAAASGDANADARAIRGSRLSVDSLEPPFELRAEGATGDEGADGGEPNEKIEAKLLAEWRAALAHALYVGGRIRVIVRSLCQARLADVERVLCAAISCRCRRTHLCRGKLSPSQRAR